DGGLLARGRPWPRPLGVDESRRHRIHARLGRKRARQILGEADEAGFAGAVGHAGARHVAPGDRGGLQTAPRPALGALAAARVQRNGPSRLVARIVAQNSSVSRSSSAGGIGATVAEVPALLTRKSSRPSASIASPTIFSAAPAFDTSPGAPITAKPSARSRSTTAGPRASSGK